MAFAGRCVAQIQRHPLAQGNVHGGCGWVQCAVEGVHYCVGAAPGNKAQADVVVARVDHRVEDLVEETVPADRDNAAKLAQVLQPNIPRSNIAQNPESNGGPQKRNTKQIGTGYICARYLTSVYLQVTLWERM
jgi:hypothetical protein